MKYRRSLRGLVAACVVTTGLLLGSVAVFAAGTGKATDTGVNIREDASTSAKAIGSTTKDVKFDIYSKKTDSAGNVWYKITVSGDTKGYVRSDYVTDVTGEIPAENGSSSTESTTTTTSSTTSSTTTSTESTASTTTSTASTVTVNPSAYTFGTTTAEVSVRESASTKSNKVATTATNQDVAITGEAKGTDGMTWYQVNYGDVKGFIRSDLLTVGEKAATPEETEPAEETETVIEDEEEDAFVAPPEPTPVVNQDYEVRYEPNEQGDNIWYLYDHNKGTRQSLDNIFAVMEQSQNMTTSKKEKSSGLKIVVIVMGVVIVVLIAVVAILAFKLRDSYEYEDDDDDDDDDEDEDDDDDNYTSSGSGSYSDDDDEDLDDEDIKVVSKQGKAKKPAGRPSRIGGDSWKNNFLDIDDDVEFEFLDLDK